jgi:hypothetical protein
MARQKRIMFLGTCRVYDPAKVIATEKQAYIRLTPHRLHTTGQILHFIDHMNQTPLAVDAYRLDLLHLVSDYAAREILVKATARQVLLDELAQLRTVWSSFDAFVIEISTRREYTASLNGQPFTVNTFSARDQQLYAAALQAQAATGVCAPALEIVSHMATTGIALREMRQIKQDLGGRPIIWVSHMRPAAADPSAAKAMQGRAEMAAFLRAAAESLGDGFVDPSETAAQMGQAVFFNKNGSDFDHLSAAATRTMAKVYLKAVMTQIALARSNATPPR